MRINYSFLDNKEPSEQQLRQLMKEVSDEVTAKAKKTEEKFFKELDELVMKLLAQKLNKEKNE